MKYSEIKTFPRACYEIDVPWATMETLIADWGRGNEICLDPDYQRGHVWTTSQQQGFIEYNLRGGEIGHTILWNCPDWPHEGSRMELLDGKQRIEAVRAWMRGDFPVFESFFAEYTGHPRMFTAMFKFKICTLPTRADVLQCYLNLNAGGTPHAQEEIQKVEEMLQKEEDAQYGV